MFTLTLYPRTILKINITFTFFLLVAGFIGQYSKLYLGHGSLWGFVQLFNLDTEATLPSWYSSTLLFCSACFLFILYHDKKKNRDKFSLHWLILGWMFLAFSVDEQISIHEKISAVLQYYFHTSGLFYFSWVIPALFFIVWVGASYARFIFELPPKIRLGFILSAVLYIGGGLVMEMLAGNYFSTHPLTDMVYPCMVILEEGLEMIGISLFLHTLMIYTGQMVGDRIPIEIHLLKKKS